MGLPHSPEEVLGLFHFTEETSGLPCLIEEILHLPEARGWRGACLGLFREAIRTKDGVQVPVALHTALPLTCSDERRCSGTQPPLSLPASSRATPVSSSSSNAGPYKQVSHELNLCSNPSDGSTWLLGYREG